VLWVDVVNMEDCGVFVLDLVDGRLAGAVLIVVVRAGYG
jgi:hypothetical protein